MPRIPDSLRALLEHLIDYAGLYPPAGLALPAVLENYEACLASEESWMLNRLVLPAAKLPEVRLRDNWRVTLLVESEPGRLPAQVETLETRLPHKLSLATYCEAPLAEIGDGAFAKVRTGGLTPEAIPSAAALADFLREAAARRIAFKATAGLHHPLRSERPLTYATGSPRATVHGFVNVFVAAAFAWQDAPRELIQDVLLDEDAGAFEFLDGELRWRGRSLRAAEVRSARRGFAHSFGSCSFAEPVADLRMPGWIQRM
ncbi:MAG TPA: hypothetical protein VMG35_19445 [Bryobacteraceae bacterium]|nr:hypothetical protein [Bryobacteraceae bacterium]